jgi:hypothetical protein
MCIYSWTDGVILHLTKGVFGCVVLVSLARKISQV